MRFSEAVFAIEDGKKVRMNKWNQEFYIHKVDGRLMWSDRSYASIGYDCLEAEWELYDEMVPVSSIKEGDLFQTSVDKQIYRLLPAYMIQYTAGCDLPDDYLPCIRHGGKGRQYLDYINKQSKVTKING